MHKSVKLTAFKLNYQCPLKYLMAIDLESLLKVMAIKVLYSDRIIANIINGHYFFVH